VVKPTCRADGFALASGHAARVGEVRWARNAAQLSVPSWPYSLKIKSGATLLLLLIFKQQKRFYTFDLAPHRPATWHPIDGWAPTA
jgi:hypothetical protein